jgi:Virulence factor BrkB
MWNLGGTDGNVLKHPGRFALAVIKQFRSNQGILLAGAVAYYTLLSLVPLLILVLMALSHIFAEDQLLQMLRDYLEFVVPGQSNALVEEVRTFLAHREVAGGVLLVTMLFFSALAFTVLENAISVIFFHRVAIKRRHFLVSAVMPYLFILFLGLGLLIVTLVSGLLQFVGTCNITFLGPIALTWPARKHTPVSGRRDGRGALAYGNLPGDAGRTIVAAPRIDRWGDRHASLGNHAPRPRLVLCNHVANAARLWFSNNIRSGTFERRVWRFGSASRGPGHR